MPRNTRTGLLFDVGTVATVALDDFGWYGVRVGGYGGPESGLGDAELQCAYGFASRPVDRGEDGKGCDVLYAHAGNSETFAWFGRDARYVDKCPPLTQGSSAQWNHKGAFVLLDSEIDSLVAYIPRGSSAHALTIGGDADNADLIDLRHASGAYLNCTTADEWTIRGNGNAFVNIKGDAVSINGALNTTANIQVGGPAALPVALTVPLTAYLVAVEALLGVMAADITAKVPLPLPTPPPPSAAAYTAFMAAATALKAAIASQMLYAV